ncbi:(2Fe-2S) ferredoxin domain-containing protein [Streptomyces tendae]|uniref:(2Fe-2S) ferredoxin domain-containing protein n=1 Tax=Streptomyces tendae TaxID=1932 RepID=UPI003812E981
MSKRARRSAPTAGPARPTVSVCRGCCCGTAKIPGLDPTAHLRRLRQALDGTATVRGTGCLDACERANIIVVQPSAEGRRQGGRPVWLGLVSSADITTRIEHGGPGLADTPDVLDIYAFRTSRRVQAELHDE